MTPKAWANLQEGDKIRHPQGSGGEWTVSANYGPNGIVLVQARLVNNSSGWEVEAKADYRKPTDEDK